MNVRKLRKEFGAGFEVSRNRRRKQTVARSGGLEYRAAEERFSSEAELAAYVRSKMPVSTIARR